MLCFLLACSLHMDRNVVVSNNYDWSGSGVILETGLVLTNQHLLGDKTYVGDNLALVVKADKELDLALLRVKTGHFRRLKFSHAHLGEPIWYVGNPGQLTDALSKGWVVKILPEHFITNTLPIPGMSGGAVYNKHGLVGLNEGYIVDPMVGVHMAIHISSEAIRKFLEGT